MASNPQATEDSLTSDGCYKTGDVGYEDPHGNLIITDRIKELIKYKGFQIAPAELEDILHGHPAVADCAVVGVPEGQVGSELPRAFVKPADSVQEGPKLAEELQAHVNGKVAHYKRLRGGVIFLETIPRNPWEDLEAGVEEIVCEQDLSSPDPDVCSLVLACVTIVEQSTL
ncbi:hypothetical protein NW754_001347 [Fusarium falciforme]|nr:hypothetical protein NW754_001347 [Fusarium falciforme]